jgi:hypothetical protein
MSTIEIHEVDWPAAVALAETLGRRTLALVARRDPEAVRAWALQMASENNVYPGTAARAASYLELAVLVGHVELEEREHREEDTEVEEDEEAPEP